MQSDFRTGTTFGKLSEIYAIPVELIVRRKQKEAWRRDLRSAVAAETFASLAVGIENSAESRDVSDEDVVRAAAKRGAQVVQRHREVLDESLAAVSDLVGELKKAAAEAKAGRVADLAFLGPRETLAEAALKIGNTLARIVPLERKAFGLDDGNDGQPFEEALRQWAGQKAAAERGAGG